MIQLLAQQTFASRLPPFLGDYIGWWVGLAAILIGLVLFGWRDTSYFSFKRVWAISGVSFSESIRRRVLWITPLAILGVIVVSQLQRPMDEQDALRQTIKFSVFATGMLVTMVVLILACTNLPKEIENRVIFTVVTKPTTRLEIVLGKTIGFARISAVILIIMGLFTWGYLHLRAWTMQRTISAQLQEKDLSPVRRAALSHYQQAGLLEAKQLRDPATMAIFARLPQGDDDIHWVYPNEMSIAAPFSLSRDQVLVGNSPDMVRPVHIVGRIMIQERELTPEEAATFRRDDILADLGTAEGGPLAPASTQSLDNQPPVERPTPTAQISIVDIHQEPISQDNEVNSGLPVSFPVGSDGSFSVSLTPSVLGKMVNARTFYVMVTGRTTGVLYGAGSAPLKIVIGPDENGRTQTIEPNASPDQPGTPSRPMFLGRGGNYGQQLPGGDPSRRPVAIYSFRQATPASSADGMAPFELRVGIERSSTEATDDTDWTHLQVQVRNRTTHAVSEPVDVYPETGRTAYFFVPAASVQGGDFEVIVRNLTEGHWVGLKPNSLWLITGNQPFGYNVFKSMLILWLMTILVISIAIFTSTFLSWPIAIVLTVVILLGHWGVMQLQDSLQRGIGNQIATDFGFTDPGQAKVVSSTVEALASTLNTIAPMLPDISQYSATEDIERGVAVPPARLWQASELTLWFGIPLTVLAYIFLRYKEVAP